MAMYSTRALAQEILGKDDKGATRELRKFLRADAVARGGKIGTDTPGKGGRYALDLTKRDITTLKKKFATWQAEQLEAAKARQDARIAQAHAKAAEVLEAPESDIEDNEPEAGDIDAMLAEIANEDETDDEV